MLCESEYFVVLTNTSYEKLFQISMSVKELMIANRYVKIQLALIHATALKDFHWMKMKGPALVYSAIYPHLTTRFF